MALEGMEEKSVETLSRDLGTGCHDGQSCYQSGYGSAEMGHKVKMGKALRRGCWADRETAK